MSGTARDLHHLMNSSSATPVTSYKELTIYKSVLAVRT